MRFFPIRLLGAEGCNARGIKHDSALKFESFHVSMHPSDPKAGHAKLLYVLLVIGVEDVNDTNCAQVPPLFVDMLTCPLLSEKCIPLIIPTGVSITGTEVSASMLEANEVSELQVFPLSVEVL